MKISVDLIPHTDFHKGLWLQSNQSPWYFFYNSPREYTLPKDSKFYKTVDDELKGRLPVKHDNGITLIFSKGNSEDSISKNWNNVYKLLNKHF